MIIEFSVQNHRSFRSEQTLSFAASNYDKTLPENLLAAPSLADTRLVKAIALYGPNAGGKSNVLLALRFLRWLVVESATGQKPEATLPAEPFRLNRESIDLPTTLGLIFIAGGIRYELAVAVTSQRIVQERLVSYPHGRAQVWYDRMWNDELKRYDWTPEKPTDFQRDPGIVEKTRENALFLSTAAQWNNSQVAPIYQWFGKQLRILNLGPEFPLSHEDTARMVNESDAMRKYVAQVLRSADLGLLDVETKEEAPDSDTQRFLGAMKELLRQGGSSSSVMAPERIWQVTFKHEGQGGESFPITWADESAGTRRFFSVLGPWLAAIQSGHVLCVDELDTSLHPSLAAELLRLLFKLTTAQRQSQLLFTTHNPLLLDMTLLRRDQVWFADKNQEGESFLYPLTDYKPRADESLVRGYLSGRYGAVPFIPRGLIDGELETPKPAEAEHAS